MKLSPTRLGLLSALLRYLAVLSVLCGGSWWIRLKTSSRVGSDGHLAFGENCPGGNCSGEMSDGNVRDLFGRWGENSLYSWDRQRDRRMQLACWWYSQCRRKPEWPPPQEFSLNFLTTFLVVTLNLTTSNKFISMGPPLPSP